jgi:hypothetical protein|tara:strand:+ start:1420 stop:2262 length:843 start_codon:yes stop_codon:yes gene_type:complete
MEKIRLSKTLRNLNDQFKPDGVKIMFEKRIERFCITMVSIQLILVFEGRFTQAFPLGEIPVAMFFVIANLFGFIGAIVGLGICVKCLIAQQKLRLQLLIACGVLVFSATVSQFRFGIQNLNFIKANDYSTDSVNPPRFKRTKHERLVVKETNWLGAFFYIPHQIIKADIDSVTLPLSPLDSKIVVKRAAMHLGWAQVGSSTISSKDIGYVEVFEFRGYRPIKKLTDMSIRVASIEPDYSVIDIRSSSRLRTRDLGSNAMNIRELASEILVIAAEYKNKEN